MSLGYNLISDVGCGLIATGDITNTNPILGILRDNGGAMIPDGTVPTHALLRGSPAIDQIPDGVNGCQAGVSVDQRGYIRAGGDEQGGDACDIGAFEFRPSDEYITNYIYLPVVLKP